MRPSLRVRALAALLSVTAIACGGDGTTPQAQPTVAAHQHGDTTANPPAGDCRVARDGAIALTAEGIAFDATCLEVPAGAAFAIAFENRDATQHNVMIEAPDGSIPLDGAYVVDGSIRYEVPALPAGDYVFHCHVHPVAMTGVLRVVG